MRESMAVWTDPYSNIFHIIIQGLDNNTVHVELLTSQMFGESL